MLTNYMSLVFTLFFFFYRTVLQNAKVHVELRSMSIRQNSHLRIFKEPYGALLPSAVYRVLHSGRPEFLSDIGFHFGFFRFHDAPNVLKCIHSLVNKQNSFLLDL